MPFKSKAQQGFMFAAEKRHELPKGTAKRWADHTPDIKKLPEHVKDHKKHAALQKLAFELGKRLALQQLGIGFGVPALEKTAVEIPWGWEGVSKALRWALPHLGPAAAGAYLAGPGYRMEGAGAGWLAGGLGKQLARSWAMKHVPAGAAEEVAKRLSQSELVGSLAGGAGGGYLAGRAMGSQNPYGLQPVFGGVGKENPMGLRPGDLDTTM